MSIDLYTWPTPNGHKVHILLEELGVPYTVIPVDIVTGEQFDPAFLKISPNNKMPALVDGEGPDGAPISLFESGAIMIYLAEKFGRFIPSDARGRYSVLQWVMFQMASIGPMMGQAQHFIQYAPREAPDENAYARNRYSKEAARLYGVVDRRLAESPYIAGEDYSIADMAVFPWMKFSKYQGVDREAFPNFLRWFDEIAERPAVKRGMSVLAEKRRKHTISDDAKKILFGDRQYERR